MSATSTRTWVAGAAVVAVLLAVASWFLLIAPARAEAVDLRQQEADTHLANDQLAAQVERLRQQYAELPATRDELAAVRRALPADAALPELTRTLDGLAASSGATLMAITPGTPLAPTTSTAPGAPAVDPATGTAPAATTAAPATMAVAVPVGLEVVGTFDQARAFLEQVQTQLQRDYLVEGLSVVAEAPADAGGGKPSTVNGSVRMTVTGTVFVLPAQPGDLAVTGTAEAVAPALAGTTTEATTGATTRATTEATTGATTPVGPPGETAVDAAAAID